MYSSVLLSLLATLAAAAPTASQDAIRVPLARRHGLAPRADGTLDAHRFLRHLEAAVNKYSSRTGAPSVSLLKSHLFDRRDTGTVPLTDQVEEGQDELYYGDVTVGTNPGQVFTVDFDTGSSDFFVPGPSCGSAQGCVGTTKYSQTGVSEGNTTSVTYGSGQVTGANYLDTVTVGGLTATGTNVVSLTSASGFDTSDSEGLMGMGFSTIANSGKPTFFENLISQGKVTSPEFAFYLGRAASGTQGASELFLGGLDSAKYTGALVPVPVTTKGYWQVALDGVKVNGASPLFTAGQAAIDTGTTIVLGPNVAVASIFSNVPGAYPLETDGTITIWAYPCDSPPDVSITFAGVDFSINPLDFSLGEVDSTLTDLLGLPSSLLGNSGPTCAAAIAGADLDPTENLYVVGDTFLKSWYSVYSYAGSASVSFGKAVGN